MERKHIAVLGDEDTILGFRLTGLVFTKNNPNFIVVDPKTDDETVESIFKNIMDREDIAIVLICEYVKSKIFSALRSLKNSNPTIIFIPNKVLGN